MLQQIRYTANKLSYEKFTEELWKNFKKTYDSWHTKEIRKTCERITMANFSD